MLPFSLIALWDFASDEEKWGVLLRWHRWWHSFGYVRLGWVRLPFSLIALWDSTSDEERWGVLLRWHRCIRWWHSFGCSWTNWCSLQSVARDQERDGKFESKLPFSLIALWDSASDEERWGVLLRWHRCIRWWHSFGCSWTNWCSLQSVARDQERDDKLSLEWPQASSSFEQHTSQRLLLLLWTHRYSLATNTVPQALWAPSEQKNELR